MIKLLSFDLDDTLWPNKPTILRAEKLLYQWLTVHVPVITQTYDLYQLRDQRLAIIREQPELAHNLSQVRLRSFELLAEEFSLPTDWMQPAFDVFYQARQQVTLFDDVKPVLDTLQDKYRLVSLTNGNASPVITGVDHWFSFSLNSETTGKSKSSAEIYQLVLEKADIDSHQMIHIGDDPVNDVSGASAAGIASIWLNREQLAWPLQNCEPDAMIASLYQLPELLENWSQN